MKLTSYWKKRNFNKTKEPKGKVKAQAKHAKERLYVIQKHAASHLHYDFRLELEGVLISWAVPKGPCLDPAVKRLAMHVEDHPIEYGGFEGLIPKGQYGGGTVMLWDDGEWESLDDDPIKAYKKGDMKFILKGEKLKGKWKIIRINKNDKTWLLIKVQDEYARPLKDYDITVEEPNSVLTGLSLEGIEESKGDKHKKKTKITSKKISLKSSRFPKSISPELATLVDKPPEGENWLHEIKFDGYRMIAFKHDGETLLYTRNQHNWTDKFPSISKEINKLSTKTLIFDGEIVVLDKNHQTNFQLLQNAIKEGKATFVYYIFDLLYVDKYDLASLPLIERKKMLFELLPENHAILRYSDHILGEGDEVFKKSCEMGLEGIISKDANSHYIQKRTKDWLKIKCIKRQEFVIGGFTKPKNSREFFGSLLLGTYNKKKELIYNGNVGTGFTQQSLKSLHDLLKKQITSKSPFVEGREKKLYPPLKDITWVKPILIAEVEFTEWTQDELLRHPSFKGLRSDKSARCVTKEVITPVKKVSNTSIDNDNFKLTSPNKILYKEDKITKQELLDYYIEVQDWILPYITQRILTLVRCPQGYQHCFYQKHLDKANIADLHPIMVKEKKSTNEYFYITNSAGLLVLPQLNVLEIHPWGSTIQEIEYPDMITFDLDPDPDLKWEIVVEAAFEVKKHLSEIHLKSFVKTTGGKGLHVVIPIDAEYEWEDVKAFAKAFVDFLVMQNPNLYVANMKKIKRKGKIFIDYLRNQRGATAIAPYSTRARSHAPVSTPVHWDELTNDFEDTFYTIKTLPARLQKLKKDPWKDFFKISQSLNLNKYKKK